MTATSTENQAGEELTVAGGPLVHAGCPHHSNEEAVCGAEDLTGTTELPINCPLCVMQIFTEGVCASCGGDVSPESWEWWFA